MKDNSNNKLDEVTVERVTVVEENVPAEDEIIVEDTYHVTSFNNDNNIPVEIEKVSSNIASNDNNDAFASSHQSNVDSSAGNVVDGNSIEPSYDSAAIENNEPISSSAQTSEHANNNTSSSRERGDDPAQSKLKENSDRNASFNNQPTSPASNNFSDTANRLRNNNNNNHNHNNGLGNRNNGNNLNSGLGNKNSGNKNNGNKPNSGLGNKKNNDKAAQRLLNNKANKKRNLPFLNRNGNRNNNGIQNNNYHGDGDGNSINDLALMAKKIKMIISILIAALPIIVILIIIIAIAAVIGYLMNIFGIVATGGGGEYPTSMTDNANEQKYYEKLDEVVVYYQKKCGITINKNYIHAVLFYPINDYDELFDQDFSFDNEEDSSNTIDYSTLSGKVDTVAELMVKNCSVEYEISTDDSDDSFFNRLKKSKFFRDYYKELLKKSSADDILTSVFELAEAGTELLSSTWYISDNLKVVQKTCNTYQYLNGTKENSTIDFSEYIMGVLYGELDTNLEIIPENKEFLKAQVIAATSYVLSRTKYQSGDEEIEVSNGNCWQVSCNIKQGCTYLYDTGEYGTAYTGILSNVTIDYNNKEYQKYPISQSKLTLLQEVMDEVFGIVMLDSSGKIKEPQYRDGSCGNDCMGQKPGMVDAKNGLTYEEILDKYYNNFTLSNISEDIYADVTYGDGGYNSNVIYYNQRDYNNKFCGRTDGTIATSGCGVTSMAIVLSTFIDDSFTPPVVMEEAYGFGSCGKGISGTSTSFFKKSAKLHGLGYKSVSKKGNLQTVINSLKDGNSLVIAHMGKGIFTRGGHYIVLARVNEKGQVYVYDCNNPKKNGWYDFNSIIVKQLGGNFHIITKG